ncbi:unnamed protein product [Rhizophagus irregularis]|nr:unnamed protein product [Rhizophagus irregularis]
MADPKNFTAQAQATNIQPTTIFYSPFCFVQVMGKFYGTFWVMMILMILMIHLVVETPPILPDVEMTPVNQTVITDDKQVKNQSTTAKPDAKTLAKNLRGVRANLRHYSLRYPIYLGPAENTSRVQTLGEYYQVFG